MRITNLITMLQGVLDEHGDMDVAACFEKEGTVTVNVDDIPRLREINGAYIHHPEVRDDHPRREELIEAFATTNRWGMFGDGLEDDYVRWGMGPYRPPYNYTTEELLELEQDDWLPG